VAERDLADTLLKVQRQRKLVSGLNGDGHFGPAAEATRLLLQFIAVQKARTADRDRLWRAQRNKHPARVTECLTSSVVPPCVPSVRPIAAPFRSSSVPNSPGPSRSPPQARDGCTKSNWTAIASPPRLGCRRPVIFPLAPHPGERRQNSSHRPRRALRPAGCPLIAWR
jgi:hypothetical protein